VIWPFFPFRRRHAIPFEAASFQMLRHFSLGDAPRATQGKCRLIQRFTHGFLGGHIAEDASAKFVKSHFGARPGLDSQLPLLQKGGWGDF